MSLRKNKKIGLFLVYFGIVLILIFGLAKYGKFLPFFSSVVFEDYTTYDDRVNPGYAFSSNWIPVGNNNPTGCGSGSRYYTDDFWNMSAEGCYGGTTTSAMLVDGKMVLSANGDAQYGGARITAIAKKDFRGNDIKYTTTYYTLSARCGSCNPEYTSTNTVTTTEIFSSKLNPDIRDIYINGVFDRTENKPGKLEIQFTASAGGGSAKLTVDSFAYKIPFSCEIGPEQIYAVESFAGPKPLSLYSLRYPVEGFCLSECPTICDSSKGGCTSENTCEIYQKLTRGEVLNIPETQTIHLKYKMFNDGSITQSCQLKYYDVNTSRCLNQTPYVSICSGGTIDPMTGSCFVTPEPICQDGNLVRLPNGTAMCVYNAPRQGVCEDPLTHYNSVTNLCEFPAEAGCPSDAFRDNSTGKCYKFPIANIQCDLGCSFNSISGWCQTLNGTICLMSNNCPAGFNLANGTCIKEIKTYNNVYVSTNTLDLPLVGIVDATTFYVIIGGLLVTIGILIYSNMFRRR